MVLNVNRVFIVTMGLAAFAALISVLLHLPVPIVLIFDLLPLCIYFWALYRYGKDGLSHTAIDSVYYFGFIVTILSLTGSVMRVWLFGIEKDMSGLIAQFGVGLLATGLALVFRLILTARVESLNAKDLSQTIEEYVQRIDKVVSRVEASAASFEGLSESLQQRTRVVVQAAFEECTASMQAAAINFSESMARVSEQATSSVSGFSRAVESFAEVTHVAEFGSNIEELSSGLKSFAAEVSSYGRRTTDEALKTTKQALDASSKWHVDSLNSMANASQQSIQTALSALTELDLNVETSTVKGDLMALSRAVTGFTKRFGELDDKLAIANARQSVEVLTPIIEGFSSDLVRTFNERDRQMLEEFDLMCARLGKETVKSITAMNDAAATETSRQAHELSAQIRQLIVVLERTLLANGTTPQSHSNPTQTGTSGVEVMATSTV